MSEQSTQTQPHKGQPPPTRAQRLAAFGFLGAFGLTILTVLLTGLRVGAPAARHVLHPAPPAVEAGAPSAPPVGRPESSSAAPSKPAAPPASAVEPRANDDDSREDARDRDDAAHEHSRKDPGDSRANDAR